MAESEREAQLRSYAEYRAALNEAQELLAQTPDDAETQEYVTEIRAVLKETAEALDATDGIVLTSHAASALTNSVSPASSSLHHDAESSSTTRHSFTMQEAAEYEVLYDGQVWYSCAVLERVPKSDPIELARYRVAILGYPDVEEVPADELRPWQPPEGGIHAKLACHALDGSRGFRPCVVDRVSPNGTVLVTFDGDEGPSSSREVPMTHIRVGKVYRQLIKKEKNISPEERKAKNAARKRERAETKRQMTADLCAQDSSDWQHMLETMTPGSAPKVQRTDTATSVIRPGKRR